MIINPYVFGAAGGGGPAGVISLLHFDGANASPTFTDETGKVWTRADAGAFISTDQSVFGGASGRFDGGSGLISTPDHADWAFGSGDFTLEGRVRTTASQTGALITKPAAGWAPFLIYLTGSSLLFYASSTGSSWDIAAGSVFSTTLSQNTWYAWAASRVGTSIYLLLDGTLITTVTTSAAFYGNAGDVEIGRWGASYMQSYLDEFRALKGTGLYTGNYTLDTSAFPYP